MILRWPGNAVRAIAALFQTLQDIDIYVEDSGSEGFYEALVRRMAPEWLRVYRVIPVNGRAAVLAAASLHDFGRRNALFLIDGDFEWVRGDAPPEVSGVYRLEAYCVENLLISEQAVTQVYMECEASTAKQAAAKLQYKQWEAEVSCLVPLFAAWAVLNSLDSTVSTVSRGLGPFLRSSPSSSIDAGKVAAECSAVEARIKKDANGAIRLQAVTDRISDLPDQLSAVSGKAFLLGLLHFHIHARTKERLRRRSLAIRLAGHTERSRLSGVEKALRRAAYGENAHW